MIPEPLSRNLAMLMDFYELTMAAGYFKGGDKDRVAVFDMFFRKVPDGGGFAIVAVLKGAATAAIFGTVAVFALVRRFGRELVEVFFPKEKIESLRFLQSSPKRDLLFWIVFVVPGTPKDLLCYFAGLTDLSWGKWLLICSLGRVPSIITSTVGGSAVGGRQYLFAILVFAGTMALSAVGLLIYRGLCRRHEKKQSGET